MRITFKQLLEEYKAVPNYNSTSITVLDKEQTKVIGKIHAKNLPGRSCNPDDLIEITPIEKDVAR